MTVPVAGTIKRAPRCDDVMAACEFLKMMERLDGTRETVIPYAKKVTRIFNVWFKTLKLEEDGVEQAD